MTSKPQCGVRAATRRAPSRRRDATFVRSIADAIVLKDRDLFLVTDGAGNVPAEAGHGLGLYLHDCRFLRTWLLEVAGVVLRARAADAGRGGVGLMELSNDVVIALPDGGQLGRQQLVVGLVRTLDGARRTVFDDLTFRNRGSARALVPLRLTFATAFEDIFEVRGLFHARGGRHDPPVWQHDRARLTYEGRDGFVRSTWLQFRPPPARTDDHGAEWD
ncbi:MAG TPA: glycogen debranching N-terminal domain-containing protein, partial [Candidatus Saccharimonadia bacterium]|nr:glycogen debranching N-terminal domain-containing protein [Candidatus Saccharimonadia bacterium]